MGDPERRFGPEWHIATGRNTDLVVFPLPQRRIENPQMTEFQPGDRVRIQIGTHVGRIGTVLIEALGNYEDGQVWKSHGGLNGKAVAVGVTLAPEGSQLGRRRRARMAKRLGIEPDLPVEMGIAWYTKTNADRKAVGEGPVLMRVDPNEVDIHEPDILVEPVIPSWEEFDEAGQQEALGIANQSLITQLSKVKEWLEREHPEWNDPVSPQGDVLSIADKEGKPCHLLVRTGPTRGQWYQKGRELFVEVRDIDEEGGYLGTRFGISFRMGEPGDLESVERMKASSAEIAIVLSDLPQDSSEAEKGSYVGWKDKAPHEYIWGRVPSAIDCIANDGQERLLRYSHLVDPDLNTATPFSYGEEVIGFLERASLII